MTPKTLRSIRRAMGWNQTELGQALGMTLRQIQRLEAGDSPISRVIALACHQLEAVPGNVLTGRELRAQRTAWGWTQPQLGMALGRTKVQVLRYEKMDAIPRAVQLAVQQLQADEG